MKLTFRSRILIIQFLWDKSPTFEFTNSLKYKFFSYLTNFAVVNLNFCQALFQLEIFCCPDISSIHFLSSLQDGYSPLFFLINYGPIYRGGSSISFYAWVYNQALYLGIDILRNWLHQSWADYQIGLKVLYSLAHGSLTGSYLKKSLVSLVN